MSFDILKLRSADNILAAANLVIYDSGSDTITEVMAASYFDAAVNHLNVDDVIQVTHPAGVIDLMVTAKGLASITVLGKDSTSVQEITDSGAVDIVTRKTLITPVAAAAMTLADADFVGQKKDIVLVVDGAIDAVITPVTGHGYTTITMADAGDSVQLEWLSALGWVIMGQGGLGTGPVAA
jgi:hypothetical protein